MITIPIDNRNYQYFYVAKFCNSQILRVNEDVLEAIKYISSDRCFS